MRHVYSNNFLDRGPCLELSISICLFIYNLRLEYNKLSLSILFKIFKNDKKNLEHTIKSVLAQNYKDFEYIIFDGLSTDRIESVINKYKKKILNI